MTDPILASFGLRGAEDHVALFRFLKELGEIEAESSENQMVGKMSASESPEAMAARCATSPVDQFRVTLADEDNSVSATLQGCVSIMSKSAEWIGQQEARWLAAGGPRALVRFACRTPIKSDRFTKPDGLRPMVTWLLDVAGAGEIDLLYYDARDYPKKSKVAASSVDETCKRLLAVAEITRIGTATLVGPKGEASVTPTYNTSAYAKVGSLDALAKALKGWRSIDGG